MLKCARRPTFARERPSPAAVCVHVRVHMQLSIHAHMNTMHIILSLDRCQLFDETSPRQIHYVHAHSVQAYTCDCVGEQPRVLRLYLIYEDDATRHVGQHLPADKIIIHMNVGRKNSLSLSLSLMHEDNARRYARHQCLCGSHGVV
jgi:hypothetical protein